MVGAIFLGGDGFPYYDETITFSENLPEYLKVRLERLRDSWERKDIAEFITSANSLEALMKNSFFMEQITKEELEKFFVMLGRDWWNRSKRIQTIKERKTQSVLANFPKP